MLRDTIKARVLHGRRRIAVGLLAEKPPPVDMAQAAAFCDIVVVGRYLSGFECVATDAPIDTLFKLLGDGTVDGIVRGQLDHTQFAMHVLELRNLQWSDIHTVSSLTTSDREFWMCPVSTAECWTKHDKLAIVRQMLRLYEGLALEPRVALISGIRKSDLGPQWYFDGLYYDCEEIAAALEGALTGRGWIRHFGIETEQAISDGANILVLPNGMVGNQSYRFLVYSGFVECRANLILGCGLNVVTNSRSEPRLASYFEWATAVANGLVGVAHI